VNCCSGCWWAFLVIFVVLVPAAAFPLPLAVLAYLIEAAMVAAAVARWRSRKPE